MTSSEKREALRECPFCDEIELVEAPVDLRRNYYPAGDVECRGCGARGPIRDAAGQRADAIERWHTRATRKSDGDGAREEWQDISTAAKNQKVIAGYINRGGKWRTVIACYHTRLEWSDDYDWSIADGDYAPEGWYEESETHETLLRLDVEPTHWRPLPVPPALHPKAERDVRDG